MKTNQPVITADTDEVIFYALKAVLRHHPFTTFYAGTMHDVKTFINEHGHATLIISDAFLYQHGEDIIDYLREENKNINVLLITERIEAYYLRHKLKLKIKGLVHKSKLTENIVKALEHSFKDSNLYCCPMVCQLLINGEGGTEREGLTEREIEILKLRVAGVSYKSAAEILCCAPNTIRKHCSNIVNKVKTEGCNSLADYAFKNKLAEWADQKGAVDQRVYETESKKSVRGGNDVVRKRGMTGKIKKMDIASDGRQNERNNVRKEETELSKRDKDKEMVKNMFNDYSIEEMAGHLNISAGRVKLYLIELGKLHPPKSKLND